MKLMLRFILLVLITQVFPCAGKAQSHSLLQDFSGYQQDDQLILRWTFRGGSLCDGTRIERSEDGLRFSEVGEIPGICGSPDNAITFTFTDSLPLPNAVNHYRLELGNYGFTTTLSVEYIKTNESGFVVHTTSAGQTDILFQNAPGRKGVAIIYSIDGRRLFEYEITGQRLSLSKGIFPSGVYLLMLAFNDNTSLSGNFIVP
ncbi:MAG: hypothetical protein HGA37_14065 [Lentimicrobium sp.]|nr:hypothetical protein [Lentimicrobium sp.]